MKNLIFVFITILLNSFSLLNIYCQENLSDPDTSYFRPSDDNFNLIIAADLGIIEHVNFLLSRGADINATTYEGVTALMYASNNGNLEMIKFLLENGAEVNRQPLSGITALMAAARANHFKESEWLITHGADPNIRDIYGVTALHYAAAYNYYELVDMLIFYGADADIPDNDGNTPLITSSFNNCYEATDILLQNGVLRNYSSKNGFTALMAAIQENNNDIIELLLEYDVDIYTSNKAGVSPISLAVKNSNYQLVNKIFQMDFKTDILSVKKSDLHRIAKENKDTLMLKILSENNVNPVFFPNYNNFFFSTSLNFNSQDLMGGFNLGILDSKLQSAIYTGFFFRPSALKIQKEFNNNIIYQYWERRYYVHLGVEKRFPCISVYDIKSGPLIALKELFSFGNYRGSINKPDNKFIFSPSIGWYINYKFLLLNFGYDYLTFKFPETRPGRYNIAIYLVMNVQRKKLINKQIPWLINQ